MAGNILWGEATGNKTIRDLGIYLYTTEVEAVCNYWLICTKTYFHLPMDIITLPWCGEQILHEIWWDGTNSEKHGINFCQSQPLHCILEKTRII